MPLVERFADFLHDLQELERATRAAQGPLILEAFTRHTPFDAGAVWLREPRSAAMRLAAKSEACNAAELLDRDVPADVSTSEGFSLDPRPGVVIPIRTSKEHFGVVALAGEQASEEDLQMLRAA